jgi:uncharacterized protein YkwD
MDTWTHLFMYHLNDIRKKKDLNPLHFNSELSEKCQSLIQEMISKNKFIHSYKYQQVLSSRSLIYISDPIYLLNIWIDIDSSILLNPNVTQLGVSYSSNYYHLYYFTYICQ